MAELNWIDKNERMPTKEDATSFDHVYVLTQNAIVTCVHLNHFKSCITSFTHWLPFREMPVPKRWRVPTIHDLAKAGKPIPCRVRMSGKDYWVDRNLIAISVEQNDPMPFAASDEKWWQGCEICDD